MVTFEYLATILASILAAFCLRISSSEFVERLMLCEVMKVTRILMIICFWLTFSTWKSIFISSLLKSESMIIT